MQACAMRVVAYHGYVMPYSNSATNLAHVGDLSIYSMPTHPPSKARPPPESCPFHLAPSHHSANHSQLQRHIALLFQISPIQGTSEAPPAGIAEKSTAPPGVSGAKGDAFGDAGLPPGNTISEPSGGLLRRASLTRSSELPSSCITSYDPSLSKWGKEIFVTKSDPVPIWKHCSRLGPVCPFIRHGAV